MQHSVVKPSHRNFVAKWARKYNLAHAEVDRKAESKRGKIKHKKRGDDYEF